MYEIRRQPFLGNDALNALFADSWRDHKTRNFKPILSRSLSYLGAFSGADLVGFLNLAWDGGFHGFVLDVTVAPSFRRQGIALAMLRETTQIARAASLEWLHVDFESELEPLYQAAGFRPSAAGLVHVPSCTVAY